jgi:hypothetical protein
MPLPKLKSKNLGTEYKVLTPEADETFASFLGRFVSDAKMTEMFPEASDRAEVASEIYDNNELEVQNNSESGSDSTPIEPAISGKEESEEDEEDTEDEAEKQDEELAYPSGGQTVAGTIPTAVVQGQGKKENSRRKI